MNGRPSTTGTRTWIPVTALLVMTILAPDLPLERLG